ncbi:hypothetical protein V1508DRAFT_404488 [Lipomyces doorenjongii]|uniref:uncharacterized protein n=1 Tax=Lipomyces doorenjongii TaxID=383834 RepID=UPI0034CF5972
MASNSIVLITGTNTGLGLETAEFARSPSVVKTIQVDIEDDYSICKAFDHVANEYGRVAFDQQFRMWNKSWNVNTTGICILTHTFVPLLLEIKEPAVAAYRSSKTGMSMMKREWTRILREDGVKVCQDINKQMGALDPSIGANLMRDVVEGARDQDIGKVVRRDGVQPW